VSPSTIEDILLYSFHTLQLSLNNVDESIVGVLVVVVVVVVVAMHDESLWT
jgi:hypothetical protein